MVVSKVLRATENGMRSPAWLKPKPCAVAVMASSPVVTPSLANTVLQDQTNASRTEASAQPREEFVSPVVVPGSRYRSEEHTSELQSRENLVCRLLLEKKKSKKITKPTTETRVIAQSVAPR